MTARLRLDALEKPEVSAVIAEMWARDMRIKEIEAALHASPGSIGNFAIRHRDLCPSRNRNVEYRAQIAREVKLRPGSDFALPAAPPKRQKFECLGDAVLAHEGGCRWPCEDRTGHWFCSAPSLRQTSNGTVKLLSYCAQHYDLSVDRRRAA